MESRHRVLSILRWGLVVHVYVSLILIPVGSPGGAAGSVSGLAGLGVLWQRQVGRGGILAQACAVVPHHNLGVKELFGVSKGFLLNKQSASKRDTHP